MSGAKTKILFVSDLHFEHAYHKAVNEELALHWFTKIIKRNMPNIVISLGDWGSAWTRENLTAILGMTKLYTISGNHDNHYLFDGLTNSDGSKVLLKDGEIREIGGVKFGFVNGAIGSGANALQFKSSKNYLSICEGLKGKVDVLCTHISPMRKDFSDIGYDADLETGSMALEIVRPKVSFSGHMHPSFFCGESVKGSVNFVVDASQRSRLYALVNTPGLNVQYWKDARLMESKNFDFVVSEKITHKPAVLSAVPSTKVHISVVKVNTLAEAVSVVSGADCFPLVFFGDPSERVREDRLKKVLKRIKKDRLLFGKIVLVGPNDEVEHMASVLRKDGIEEKRIVKAANPIGTITDVKFMLKALESIGAEKAVVVTAYPEHLVAHNALETVRRKDTPELRTEIISAYVEEEKNTLRRVISESVSLASSPIRLTLYVTSPEMFKMTEDHLLPFKNFFHKTNTGTTQTKEKVA